MRTLCCAVLLLAACSASVKKYDMSDARKMTQDPELLLDYLITQLLADETGPAYDSGLSAETKRGLSYQEFRIAVTRKQGGAKPLELDVTRRLLRGLRQHELRVDGASATARWCNAEFGLSHSVRMSQQEIGRGKFWSYDFTVGELAGFMEAAEHAALAWYRRQKEVADDRLYAYPSDWQCAPLGGACSHAR